MALNKLLADLSIISKLGTNPGIDDGLSEEQLKAKFDEAANIIKDYLNNYLILEIEKTVDVEALLSDILDVTLSKQNKAANAAATGEAIRGLRSFFEKVVHGGDYVLESDGSLAAEISGSATIRVMGGEGVMQGNLFALNLGTYEDVELLDGTYGLCRNDLIVVRCTKDDTNALSYALVGLTGAQTSGEPVDPEYSRGDINADGTVRDFPLYRIRFDGYDITKITPLFEAQPDLLNVAKLYADTTKVDKANVVNNLTTTKEGYVADARALNLLNTLIDSKLSMELVWENASPASTFSSQNVSLTVDDDDIVMVEAASGSNVAFGFGRVSTSSTHIHRMHGMSGTTLRVQSRSIRVDNSGVTFGDGQYKLLNSTEAAVVDNSLLVPIKIYIIKGVSA